MCLLALANYTKTENDQTTVCDASITISDSILTIYIKVNDFFSFSLLCCCCFSFARDLAHINATSICIHINFIDLTASIGLYTPKYTYNNNARTHLAVYSPNATAICIPTERTARPTISHEWVRTENLPNFFVFVYLSRCMQIIKWMSNGRIALIQKNWYHSCCQTTPNVQKEWNETLDNLFASTVTYTVCTLCTRRTHTHTHKWLSVYDICSR